jgi:hypothetical protein
MASSPPIVLTVTVSDSLDAVWEPDPMEGIQSD